jgi:hypothetical protein
LSRAAWTWAIDALARGSSSIRANASAPSSWSIVPRISANGTGGASSTSFVELVDVDVREQIRPRREQLAELHVGGAQLLQRLAELLRPLPGRRPFAHDADLAQDAGQLAAPRDAHDLEGPPNALCACHGQCLSVG